MPSLRATLRNLSQQLSAVSDTPELEAEILLTHVFGWTRVQLLTRIDESHSSDALEALVQRRLAHEPIAYILGNWEFYSMALAVEAPLLVPRPETEHLVEVALSHIVAGESRVLDLCTGTGCVALAIAHEGRPAYTCATDIHPIAIRVATENAKSHQLPVTIHQGDLFAALDGGEGPFDVIVSNPPYVEASVWDGLAPDIRDYEDAGALLSGADGLDCIRRIIQEAPSWLRKPGFLAMEMGESQGAAVRELLEARGFRDIGIKQDLAGLDRIAFASWS